MSAACRRHTPLLFVELIAVANWYLDGDAISVIAARLQRSIPEVRVLIFGDVA